MKRVTEARRIGGSIINRRQGVRGYRAIEGETEAHKTQRRRNHSMFIPGEYYLHGKTERDYFKENLAYYMRELESEVTDDGRL